MVGPRGIGHPYVSLRATLFKQIGQYTQCTAAANRLHCTYAGGIRIGPKDLCNHGGTKRGTTGGANVRLGILRFEQLFLGVFHSSHDRCLAS